MYDKCIGCGKEYNTYQEMKAHLEGEEMGLTRAMKYVKH